jgi:hypothetical protein
MTGDPILTLLIAAFFIGFALRLLYLQHREQTLARESVHWPRATGRVIYSGLKNYKPTGPRYGVNIIYEYSVHGATYRWDRREFGIINFPNRYDAVDIVVGHRPGSHVKVHYRPTNPQCATLSIRARGGDFAIGYLFIVVIIVIGSSWLLDAIGQLFS